MAGPFWVTLVRLLAGLGALIVSIVLGICSARAAEDSAVHARASAEAAIAATRAEQERYYAPKRPEQRGAATGGRRATKVFDG